MHLSPFLDEPRSQPYLKTHAQKNRGAIETIRRCREAVGDEVDRCVEIHRRLTPAEAVVLARGIEPYYPMFYEDLWGRKMPSVIWGTCAASLRGDARLPSAPRGVRPRHHARA